MKALGPIALLMCSAVVAVTSPATRADACSYYPRFPGFAEPLLEAPEIVIEGARLELSCRDTNGAAACSLEARYNLHNTATKDRESNGALFSGNFIPTAGLDSPSGEVVVPLERATRQSVRPLLREGTMLGDFTHYVSAFRLALRGGERRELRVRGSFTIPPSIDPCTIEGVFARHPYAASGRRTRSYVLRYVQAIADRPERPYKLEIHARFPSTWEGAIGAAEAVPLRTSQGRGFSVMTGSVTVMTDTDMVFIEMLHPRSPLLNGGPFIGAGYAFSSDSGLRVRVGYEIAAPAWVLESIALESDLRRRLTVIPAVEAITRWQALSPYIFGAGVGIPVGIRPEARLGARAQLSASFWLVTLRGSVDVLPAFAPGLPVLVEGTLGAQISP
jgi:hypothetical protein